VTGEARPAFSADPTHVAWFGGRIVTSLASPPQRVLDVGCGDGALLRYLAGVFPGATLVGVDLAGRSDARDRVAIVRGDYLTLDAGRFDLIVASSSLQGINTSTDALAAKLARDLAPGGYLIHVTPYRCVYNAVLNVARRVLRLLRGGATDRMILMAARTLHPAEPRAKLAQRVDYMYLILRHYEDDLRAVLERRGLTLHHSERAPHTSLGQPKHRFAVMSAPAR
jgi:trans-aconitate methyltransferase